MINKLNEIVTDFIAQKSSLHDACWYLTTTLDENPSLTAEQWSETYRMYGQWLEEVYSARMRAVAQGERAPNPPRGADAPGEDGAREPDVDDEVGAPVEDCLRPSPWDILALRPRQGGWGTVLKQTSDDEGNDHGDFTWNWDKPRGGPPWCISKLQRLLESWLRSINLPNHLNVLAWLLLAKSPQSLFSAWCAWGDWKDNIDFKECKIKRYPLNSLDWGIDFIYLVLEGPQAVVSR